MDKFFEFTPVTEVIDPRLSKVELYPFVLNMMFCFAFNREVDADDFVEETHYDDCVHASMIDFSGIESFLAERDEELFNDTFIDQCTFYDAVCEELKKHITTPHINVDWEFGWSGRYIVFHDDTPVVDDDEDEDDPDGVNDYYVWRFDSGKDAGAERFHDYECAVDWANDFVKDYKSVGEFVDNGDYVWGMNEGERIAIVRDYWGSDLYLTDVCCKKAEKKVKKMRA